MRFPNQNRRQFLAATGSAMAALVASGCSVRYDGAPPVASGVGYGALTPDPAGLVDLPQGFSYKVISQLGDTMTDGFTVPDAADGMGCFDLGDGKIALVRNHECIPGRHDGGGVMGPAFDTLGRSLVPLPGGTTTLVLDAETLALEKEYRSLAGTIRNCAGGVTPWGSWLSCEENTNRADGRINQDHGWVFEVPADAPGLVDPVPLKALGRFNHEAACVDPATGIVYLTEDRGDSLLYRFIPNSPGILAEGGKLEALVIERGPADTRNWEAAEFPLDTQFNCSWIEMDEVEAPDDDLRTRGAARGAAVFARGEGIWMGDGEFYFACTNGGAAKLGQIFKVTTRYSGRPTQIELFYESTDPDQFNYGDNLTIAPDGQLVVCEDQYGAVVQNYIRGMTKDGQVYPLAFLNAQTEWAGACFSPDGKTLFVNVSSPTKTLAITGPWQHLG